jgi:FkbM family methyltransferase
LGRIRRNVNRVLPKLGFRIVKVGEGGTFRPSVFDRLDHMAAAGFRPGTVLDVGAAFGIWTAECRTTFPKAKYILVEPNPAYHDALAGEVLIPAAAGSVSERRTLLLPSDPAGGSFLPEDPPKGYFENEVEVPVVRLDEVVTEPMDLVKLDVQGFEIEAMEGATRILRDCEVLIAECSLYPFQRDIPLIHEVIAYLMDKGFCVYDYGGEVRWSSKTLAQLDLIFVKKESGLRRRELWA